MPSVAALPRDPSFYQGIADALAKDLLVSHRIAFDMYGWINVAPDGLALDDDGATVIDSNAVWDCGSACCIAGVAMVLDDSVESVGLRLEYPQYGLCNLFLEHLFIDGKPIDQERYSRLVFGSEFRDLTFVDHWPVGVARMYEHYSDGSTGIEDADLDELVRETAKVSAGIIALICYMDKHFGLPLVVPDALLNTLRDLASRKYDNAIERRYTHTALIEICCVASDLDNKLLQPIISATEHIRIDT